MTPTGKPDRCIMHWETTGVTALPVGWRNVYSHDDGTATTTPCPALLLQELREARQCWDVPRGNGTFDLKTKLTRYEPPYETRVVFADVADFGAAYLEPADDTDNYVQTIGPDEAMPKVIS